MALFDPQPLHPALWLASQLTKGATSCVDTGIPVLSHQLPGGGWPTGVLTELLLQQPGVGELRLLKSTLARLNRPAALLQPPYAPQALGFELPPEQLLWIRNTGKAADSLWAAEQILRSGSCGAVLLWQQHIRNESLRRLHLAAQCGEALFFLLRPIAAAQDSSPAPLRLALRPAPGGINIEFVKRRGPQRDTPLFLPLTPTLLQRHAPVDRPLPAPATARSVLSELVG
ncbi:translesion DNA synthesis-associated protein ImuA [Pseudoduganella sp. R-43]|uniref:translesion DNA synthesis-associated protein ImuA n=1 Tax=unclassified Pseudoduganella TaxID=2637179 RepID=UPI003CF13D79